MILQHWTQQLHNFIHAQPIEAPLTTIDPTTWKITQAHHHQHKIGWAAFFRGILSIKWTDIQRNYYNTSASAKQNIHRWQRLVVAGIHEIMKELWSVRCGFIHGEGVCTAQELRTLRTF